MGILQDKANSLLEIKVDKKVKRCEDQKKVFPSTLLSVYGRANR